LKTVTVWKTDEEFTSYQDDNAIAIDGNRQKGISPKALLLSGVGACSAIDVVSILTKMRVTFSDFTIDVEADQTEEHPKVFKDINITYHIKTAKENEDKVRKAIDLSLEKYCGVSAMLRKHSPINYKLQLIQ
jgi:putative redox protein